MFTHAALPSRPSSGLLTPTPGPGVTKGPVHRGAWIGVPTLLLCDPSCPLTLWMHSFLIGDKSDNTHNALKFVPHTALRVVNIREHYRLMSGLSHQQPCSCPMTRPAGYPLLMVRDSPHWGFVPHLAQVCVGDGTGQWEGCDITGRACLLSCSTNTAQDSSLVPGVLQKAGPHSPARPQGT